jgi:hypothetical protein
MNQSEVVVCGDALGNVIGVSRNNPEWGYVLVEQSCATINNGWVQVGKRSALIKGKVSDLKRIGLKAGQIVPGKIVIKESLKPFNTVNPNRDIKMAGESGIPCLLDDQYIYRTAYFTTDDNERDELIQHNNTDDIKAAVAAQKSIGSLVPTL